MLSRASDSTSGISSIVASTSSVEVSVGPIGTAREVMMSPVSSSPSIRCAVSPVSAAPLINAQITGENPVNAGSSESCRFTVPYRGIAKISGGNQVRQLLATMMSGAHCRSCSINASSGRFAKCTSIP